MKKTIKCIISLVLSFAMVFSFFSAIGITSFAENDIVRYLEYVIKDGKVTITNSDYEISGDIVIPDTIEGYPVVAIRGGFHSRKGITSLTIGDGDFIIGSQAFHSCSALESIEIGDGDLIIEGQAFHSCSALESIEIGDGDLIIESQVFYDCTGLTSIKIGDGLFVGSDSVFADTAYYNNSENWTYGMLYAGNNLLAVKENVTSCEIKEGTTSIGACAFYGCNELTSITIPDGVKYIGDYAFAGCGNLTEIILPDSVKYIGEGAFEECYKLTDITIPDGVEYISDRLFRNCNSLKNVTIPEGVVFIGEEAFCYCDTLTELTIPGSVVRIGDNAFYECEKLSEITISEGVKSIGDYTFTYCYNLESVKIASSVETIGKYAFSRCSSLTGIQLPEGIVSIGDSAFEYCTTLTSVTIPASTEYIGIGAFSGCSDIKKFTVAENNGKYSCDENGVIFNNDKTALLHYPPGRINASYTVPDTVIIIGQSAFSGAEYLNSVIMPDGVTVISDNAFRNCESIKKMTLPDSITSIGYSAFENCYSLSDINIPDGITSLSERIFYGCNKLSSIIIPESITTIGNYAFYCCDSLTDITIPDSVLQIANNAFYGTAYYDADNRTDGVLYIGNHLIDADDDIISCDIREGTVSISSSAFAHCRSLTEVNIPDGVLRIGAGAFSYCESLTDITIPDSVIHIGANAFDYTAYYNNESNRTYGMLYIDNHLIDVNSSVTSCSIKEGTVSVADYAFDNCYNLTDITFPDSLKSIGNNAFAGWRSLNVIRIPANVMYIGDNVFENCSFSAIFVDENNEYFSSDENGVLFNKDKTVLIKYPAANQRSSYTVPDSVKHIEKSAFRSCGNLKKVVLPDGVEIIDDYAFSGCRCLKEINIPKGVTYIGKYAFSNCAGLSDITIPDGVTYIGEEAFANCYGFTSVTIPDSVTYIGDMAFYANKNLTNLTLPSGTATLGNNITFGCLKLNDVFVPGNEYIAITELTDSNGNKKVVYNYDGDYHLDSELNDHDISCNMLRGNALFADDSTYIASENLSGAVYITNVFIPESVKYIGKFAFIACAVTDVYYGGNEEDWEKIAIDYGNNKLDSVTIHYNVESSDMPDIPPEEPTTIHPPETTTWEPETTTTRPPETTEPTTRSPETTTQEPETTTTRPPETTTWEPETTTTRPPESTTREPDTTRPPMTTTEPTTREPDTTRPSTTRPPETTTGTGGGGGLDPHPGVNINIFNFTVIIGPGMRPDDFKNNVYNNTVIILSPDGKVLDETISIGTGCIINVCDNHGNIIFRYDACVSFDVSGDGKVTAADARLTLRAAARIDIINGVYAYAADSDGDGKISAGDARAILRKAAGLDKEETTASPDFERMENLLNNTHCAEFDCETADTAYVVDDIIHAGICIPTYNSYFGSETYQAFDEGNQIIDPLNKFIAGPFNGIYYAHYFKVPAENIKWICENIYQTEFDENYTSNTGESYYYDGYVYIYYPQIGGLLHEASIDRYQLLSDGKYEITVQYYVCHQPDEDLVYDKTLKVIAEWKQIDGKYDWVFYSVEHIDSPDFDRMETLVTNMFGNTFDYKTADTAYVVDYLIHAGMFLPTYETYFGEDTYYAYGEGNTIADPLKKFETDRGSNHYPYYKIPAENVKWICENIYQVEFDANYVSNTGESYCYGDYVYIIYPQAGYGPFEFKTEISECHILDDGRYEITAYYSESDDYGETFDVRSRLKIVAEWKLVDGKYDWVFYNIDKLN